MLPATNPVRTTTKRNDHTARELRIRRIYDGTPKHRPRVNENTQFAEMGKSHTRVRPLELAALGVPHQRHHRPQPALFASLERDVAAVPARDGPRQGEPEP